MLALRRSGDRILVTVLVAPRAAVDLAGGERAGALLVRVTAAPADGKANAAVVRALAKALAVPPSEVLLVRGATARTKLLSLPASTEPVLRRLAQA